MLVLMASLIWLSAGETEESGLPSVNDVAWHQYCCGIGDVLDDTDHDPKGVINEWYPVLNNTCIELNNALPPGNISIVGHGSKDYQHMYMFNDWVIAIKIKGKYRHYPSQIKYYSDTECNKLIYIQKWYYKTQFNTVTVNNELQIQFRYWHNIIKSFS